MSRTNSQIGIHDGTPSRVAMTTMYATASAAATMLNHRSMRLTRAFIAGSRRRAFTACSRSFGSSNR